MIKLPENFFTAEYLLSAQAPTDQTLFLVVLGVFALFIVIAILLGYNQSIHRGLKNRLFNFFLTIGILGLLFSFFRYEGIQYIGYRVVILALIPAVIIWYLVITVYSVTKMPREIRAIKNHQRYVQYLPKKKRKN